MENIEETVQEQQAAPKLIVTEEMRSYIYEIAKWASFLAIVGFVISGLMIISAFTVGSMLSTNKGGLLLAFGAMGPAASIIFTIIFLVYAFIIFYPSLLMFKYSTKAKLGVLYGEQESLDEAFGKLKSLFKYWGILMIVVIGLYLLLIISTVVGGVAAA